MSGRSEKKGSGLHAIIICAGFWTFISIFMLLSGYDKISNGHVGFRNALVRLNSLINMRIFNVSPSARIILGKDSWLFYDDPKEGVNLRDFRGGARFNDLDLQRARNKVFELRQSLEKRGIKLLIVVVPNKHTIYPEYLPHGPSKDQRAVTRLDQLADAFKDFGVDFIDLRGVLVLGKNSPYPLYYQTDSHWNAWGAFVAYGEIMNRVMKKRLRVDILKASDFRIGCHDGRGTGDLASILNMSGLLADSELVMRPLNAFRGTNVKASDQYTSISEPETVVREVKDSKLAKLLMFRDSFADALIPYLSESFSRSVYVSASNIDFSTVENEKPDLVILEMAERYVGSLAGESYERESATSPTVTGWIQLLKRSSK